MNNFKNNYRKTKNRSKMFKKRWKLIKMKNVVNSKKKINKYLF